MITSAPTPAGQDFAHTYNNADVIVLNARVRKMFSRNAYERSPTPYTLASFGMQGMPIFNGQEQDWASYNLSKWSTFSPYRTPCVRSLLEAARQHPRRRSNGKLPQSWSQAILATYYDAILSVRMSTMTLANKYKFWWWLRVKTGNRTFDDGPHYCRPR